MGFPLGEIGHGAAETAHTPNMDTRHPARPHRATAVGPPIERTALHANAVRLYRDDQLSIQSIAQRLGYSYYTVRKHLMAQQVALRPRGWRPTSQ
ncbi:helix-turn-helix domain-containing protein [Streptomyces sp. NPDC059819]|uniref:helix-turn-helix domain-containing protein n=1 Tax=Streptomyces sp. NPDC059819 TaxID=3346963 RepID=UPI003647D4B7